MDIAGCGFTPVGEHPYIRRCGAREMNKEEELNRVSVREKPKKRRGRGPGRVRRRRERGRGRENGHDHYKQRQERPSPRYSVPRPLLWLSLSLCLNPLSPSLSFSQKPHRAIAAAGSEGSIYPNHQPLEQARIERFAESISGSFRLHSEPRPRDTGRQRLDGRKGAGLRIQFPRRQSRGSAM